MPALSWNEIRQRAVQFSHDWKDVKDERAEAQSFWNDFFQVFGIQRRAVDKCYRPQKFQNERERVEFLFGLYEKMTAELL
jgi:hypothetical protein